MPFEPTRREKQLMIQLGFKTREEMMEWWNRPTDPEALERLSSVYPDDEMDLDEDEE